MTTQVQNDRQFLENESHTVYCLLLIFDPHEIGNRH